MVDLLLSGLRLAWNWIVIWDASTIIAILTLLVSVGALVASRRQNKASQRALLNNRYQKAVRKLGDEALSIRLAGIKELQRLAEDHPKQYHIQIMGLLCDFVRYPTEDKGRDDNTRSTSVKLTLDLQEYRVRADVQAAMTAIGTRSDADVELEKKANFSPDLSDAYLPFVWLYKANLTDANLTGARFYPENLTLKEQHRSIELFQECAYLTEANLSNAFLTGVNLTNANLSADLSGAMLVGANLTSTFLSRAKGLTQRHLNQACADPDNPPNLGSLRDAETGALLEWCGKPC